MARRIRIAATGHANIEEALEGRPPPAKGERYAGRVWQQVYADLRRFVVDSLCPRLGVGVEALVFVSGMARGVDEVWAHLAMDWDCELVLVVPGSVRWHRSRPPSRGIRAQAIHYERMLRYPNLGNVIEVGKNYGSGGFRFVNFARNQAMVDLADWVVSYRVRPSSGTDDCIRRAKAAGKYMVLPGF